VPSSLDAKRANAGDGLHRLELHPGLLETDRRKQFHQPCADLFDLALRPDPDWLEDDRYPSLGFGCALYLLRPGFLIRPERHGIGGERFIEKASSNGKARAEPSRNCTHPSPMTSAMRLVACCSMIGDRSTPVTNPSVALAASAWINAPGPKPTSRMRPSRGPAAQSRLHHGRGEWHWPGNCGSLRTGRSASDAPRPQRGRPWRAGRYTPPHRRNRQHGGSRPGTI
jgi:hypothetical protein